MNLNPAVVTVTMVPAGESGTTVHLRGAAKEGLIKQRAGQKAVERLVARLTNCASSSHTIWAADRPFRIGHTWL